MLTITPYLTVSATEIQLTYICSPGPGGQNVNKVATAVQLRFNVLQSSSLPEEVRSRLIASLDKRLTVQGDLIIKASRFRTQERNKQDALQRLAEIIRKATIRPRKRKKTKPTYASIQKRLQTKKLQAKKKSLRRHDVED